MVVIARPDKVGGKRGLMREKTAPQIHTTYLTDNELPKEGLGTSKPTYQKVRLMRKDPTIAFARWLSVAPVLASEWAIEAGPLAPEGARELIEKEVLPIKNPLVRSSFYGGMDYGWQGYEKVFVKRDTGYIGLKKMKQLLPDYTTILVDEHGSYIGLRQDYYSYKDVDLQAQKTLTIAFDVEGTDWYGHSSMEAAQFAFDRYQEVATGASRYDRKVAGSHWVVHYPPGVSKYNGVDMDNQLIAVELLGTLQASGSIAVPRSVSNFISDPTNQNNENAWEIELKSDQSSASSGFNERMRYYDSLKVRSFGLPERSVLEGQFGTKAEAESHADAAVLNMDMRHQSLCDQYNWHIVNQLLTINFGPEASGTVWINPSAIVDRQRQALTDIYNTLLKNPVGYIEALKDIDLYAMEKELGIPLLAESKTDLKENVLNFWTKPQNPDTETPEVPEVIDEQGGENE